MELDEYQDIGLIGRKVGMTQVFQDDGTMVAVCVLASNRIR